MAGAFIVVQKTGIERASKLFNRLIRAGQSLEAPFAQIGEYLIESHQARFQLEVAPDGEPWEPLDPKTVRRKKGDDRILRDSDTLSDTLFYQLSSDELEFGSDKEYAATHHFGREADGIPARPIFGLATSPFNDEDEIVAILQDHLIDAIK